MVDGVQCSGQPAVSRVPFSHFRPIKLCSTRCAQNGSFGPSDSIIVDDFSARYGCRGSWRGQWWGWMPRRRETRWTGCVSLANGVSSSRRDSKAGPISAGTTANAQWCASPVPSARYVAWSPARPSADDEQPFTLDFATTTPTPRAAVRRRFVSFAALTWPLRGPTRFWYSRIQKEIIFYR